jgi:hypothetical protein
MRRFLILNQNEKGRGTDLPTARRDLIAEEGRNRGFTIQGAMSLRRQFIRELAGKRFFDREMGSEQGAQEHALDFEALTADYLTTQGISFVTERQLLDHGVRSTPDFVLVEKITINGKPVAWIDCKTFYGSSLLVQSKKGRDLPIQKLRSQAMRYIAEYGNGAFLFLSGFSKDFCRLGNLPEDKMLMLDATPLEISTLY